MRLPARYPRLPAASAAALRTAYAAQPGGIPECVRWSRAERAAGLTRLMGDADDGRPLVHWRTRGGDLVRAA